MARRGWGNQPGNRGFGGNNWYGSEYDPVRNGAIDGLDTYGAHDHAVVRAVKASKRYKPERDPKIEGDPWRTIFVGKLNFETTEDKLGEVFGQFGKIKRLRLVRHIVSQASRGYAFIEYEDDHGFQEAYRLAHKMVIDDMEVLVDYQREITMPGWIPRRFGGGLGGKKESGQLRFGGRERPFKRPIAQSVHIDPALLDNLRARRPRPNQ